MPGPRFTIVLPVRNGGEYVKDCVASILAQSRADDFELLVLDNFSTDGTTEWLATLRDPRVRLYPADRPLSIEENWARIKDLPKQEFVTTIGHDDLLDADFLEVIAGLIRDHPDASLYLTHFRIIDSHGAFTRHCRPMPARETAAEFLAARLCHLRDSYGTGYVMRSRDYDAVGGIPPYPKLLYADDALFVQLSGLSYRATALRAAFSYRIHAASTSGSCAARDTFRSFEQYRELLITLHGNNPDIREVLGRHFAAYASSVGLVWLMEERLAAYDGHRKLDPEIEPRVRALAATFGGGLVRDPHEGLRSRLLERAMVSRPHRFLYRFLMLQKETRAATRRFMLRTLSGKPRTS